MSQELSHFDESGASRMVDTSDKPITLRVAQASARVDMKPETVQMILDHQVAKGDVFEVARLAGAGGSTGGGGASTYFWISKHPPKCLVRSHSKRDLTNSPGPPKKPPILGAPRKGGETPPKDPPAGPGARTRYVRRIYRSDRS